MSSAPPRRSLSRHNTRRRSGSHKRNSQTAYHTSKRGTGGTRRVAQRSQRRLNLFFVGVVIVALAFSSRLAYVQVFSSERYVKYGISQRMKTVTLAAERGTIFDRDGVPLAVTAPSETLWANPKLVKDAYVTANAIAPLLQMDAAEVQQKLSSDSSFVYIDRQIDDAVAKKVTDLHLPGIFTIQEPKREALSGDSGSAVIGKVGVDNTGLSGLELQYNKQLAGKAGRLYAERDVAGRTIPGGHRQALAPVQGNDLVLTLDQSMQQVTQQSLSDAIARTGAKGGIAIVMQTQTGDVMALSNLIKDTETGEIIEAPNNMAATNVYEPGSVNKMITISAALEAGAVTPSTVRTVPSTVRVADKVFGEAEPHGVQQWTTTDILANSSNVGTIQIAQNLGKQRIDEYMRRFGLGTKTGLSFPGESGGILLQPKHWYPTSIGTIPIGQGVSVTAMQMISAFNSIANGGLYVQPRLVRSTIDGNGKRHDVPVGNTHRVVSANTARQMTGMLNEVTRVGTGTRARIDGYTVAGKTGTARKPKVGGVGYQDGAYVSTFVGFAPAEKPMFTTIVILDQPTPIYGGLVCAPVFADIMKYALGAYHVTPPEQVVYSDVPQAHATAVDTNEALQAHSSQSTSNSGSSSSSTVPGTNKPTSKTATKQASNVSTDTAKKPVSNAQTTTSVRHG